MKNKRTLEIGTKKLSSITSVDTLQLAILEGCCACLEYWHNPVSVYFDDTMFSTTVCIDYISFRKEDNIQTDVISFYFNFKELNFHYHKENKDRRVASDRLSLESIKYLIAQGYDVPIY